MLKQLLRLLILFITFPVTLYAAELKDYKGQPGLFGQTDFDTPLIDAEQFATKNDLASASSYVKSLCHMPGLQCVAIKPNEKWVRIFPDFTERNTIMRLNRMNVALSYRHWLLVPKDWRHLNDLQFSPMPLHRQTYHHKLLLINLKKFAFGAYDENGRLLRWGPVSGGQAWCPILGHSCLSAAGAYTVYRKGGASCRSATYPIVTKGGAPMPYCMFYYKGYAIHASSLSGFLNRSRGCLRLFFNDAKWLNQQFVKIGTRVLVIR